MLCSEKIIAIDPDRNYLIALSLALDSDYLFKPVFHYLIQEVIFNMIVEERPRLVITNLHWDQSRRRYAGVELLRLLQPLQVPAILMTFAGEDTRLVEKYFPLTKEQLIFRKNEGPAAILKPVASLLPERVSTYAPKSPIYRSK